MFWKINILENKISCHDPAVSLTLMATFDDNTWGA